MKVSIQKRIGKLLVAFEGEDDNYKKALAEAIKLAEEVPTKCSICNSEDVSLRRYDTKEGWLYVMVQCNACGASSTMGEGKDGKNFWWKDFEAKVEGSNKNSQPVEAPAAETAPVSEDPADDLPF